MTTIMAFRDAIYADSRCTEDGTHYSTVKIFQHGDAIVACSGWNIYINEFRRQFKIVEGALKSPMDIKRDGDDPVFAALVLTPAGLWVYDTDFGYDPVDGLYYAIGSGRKAALGALHALKAEPSVMFDPIRVIKAACKTDIYSGLPVQYMRLGEYALRKEW